METVDFLLDHDILKIKKVCPAESSAGVISFVRLHHFVGGKVMPINELWYHGENEADEHRSWLSIFSRERLLRTSLPCSAC